MWAQAARYSTSIQAQEWQKIAAQTEVRRISRYVLCAHQCIRHNGTNLYYTVSESNKAMGSTVSIFMISFEKRFIMRPDEFAL